MSTLNDQVALVTGASRGIGRAIALCFAREGADLILPPHAIVTEMVVWPRAEAF